MSILITGGAKGIGKGIALRFATPGNTVFINYVSDDRTAEETAAEVEAKGATVHLIKQDASGPEGAGAIIEKVREHTDVLDQVVHGAVRPCASSALDIDPDDFRQAIDLNGSGLLYMTQAARPLLQRGSTVFFLSSRGSYAVVPNYLAVGAGKALAECIARYLAVELAPHGIRINTVSCSTVLTDAYKAAVGEGWEERAANAAANSPSGRNVTPEDVGAAVEFLSGPGGEMINGQNIMLDGAYFLKT
jgi:enoyl-[acyl-carrier protein] reductase III